MHSTPCRSLAALTLCISLGMQASALAADSKALAPMAHLAPLVTLSNDGESFDFHGNTVCVRGDGFFLASAALFEKLPATDLIPVSRLGVLVPEASLRARTSPQGFRNASLVALDAKLGWALLKVSGDLGKVEAVEQTRTAEFREEVDLYGYGAPGIRPQVFSARVATFLPAAQESAADRLGLDGRVGPSAAGGLVLSKDGKVLGVTVFHLKNVHRVNQKFAKFEWGPFGTAVGLPIQEALNWAQARMPKVEK